MTRSGTRALKVEVAAAMAQVVREAVAMEAAAVVMEAPVREAATAMEGPGVATAPEHL
jgi:hypothetical protein